MPKDSRLNIFQPGIRAVRENWAPILVLQTLAIIMVASYYNVAAVRTFAESVSRLKESGGVIFVLISGSIAGGFLPQLATACVGTPRGVTLASLKDAAYNGFVFAIIAVEVNAFYGLQNHLFGTSVDPATVTKKILFDMFCFSPLLFNPTGMLLLHARSVRFKPREMVKALRWSFYRDWVLPTQPLNLAFWIPIVACVYSLPQSLQFPFSQVSEACWALMFVFIAKEAAHREPAPDHSY